MIRSLAGVSVGWLGISMVADGVPALLLPHRILETGRDPTYLGLVTLVAIAAAALVQPVAGAWSDRAGRGPVLVVGVAVAATGLTLLLSSGWLLPAAALTLVGVSVAQAAYQGLLPDRIVARWRGRAAGAKGLFDVGGAFLAFALLASVLAAGEPGVAALLLGIGLAGSLAAALLLLRSPRKAAGATGRTDAVGAPVITGARPELVQLVVARFLFLLGIYAVGRFMLLFVAERLGLDADAAGAHAGTLLAALTLVTAVAALPAGWMADRVGRGGVMLAGALVAASGVAALPLADSFGLILGFGTLMALGSAAFGVGSWATLADLTEGPDSGRLLGLANFGTAGAAAAAGLFGLIIDGGNGFGAGQGYTIAFVLAGIAAVAGGILAWRIVPSARAVALRTAMEVPD